MKKENIAGRKYNLLKVIEDTGEIRVLCQCDCGTIKKVNRWHLMNGSRCISLISPGMVKGYFARTLKL